MHGDAGLGEIADVSGSGLPLLGGKGRADGFHRIEVRVAIRCSGEGPAGVPIGAALTS